MKNFTFEKRYLKIFILALFLMFSISLVHAAEDTPETFDPFVEDLTDRTPAADATRGATFYGPGGNPDDPSTADLPPNYGQNTNPTPIARPNLEAYSAGDVGMFSYFRSSFQSVCTQSGGSLSSGALGPLALPFETIMKILTSELAVFVLMFLFFFMLMYGIVYVSLTKARVFKDQKKQLKIVSVSISFIVNLSFFGLTARHGGPRAVLMRFMELGELLGAILLLTIMFFILYYLFKKEDSAGSNWKAILLGIGIGMILVGQLVCRESWVAWGAFAVFIALISFLIGGLMGMGQNGTQGTGGNGGTGGTGPGGHGGITPHQVQNFNGVYNP